VENEVVKNSRLASENEQLKIQLKDLSKNVSLASDVESRATPVAARESTETAEDHAQLAEKYNELSKKYHDLSQKIKYLERKNTAVMQKNKDMKESVRAWQEYADRQSGRQKPKSEIRMGDDRPRLSAIPQIEDIRPHMPSSPRSVATVRTPLSTADMGRSSPAPIALLASAEYEDEDTSASPGIEEDAEATRTRSRGGSVTPKPTNYGRRFPYQQEIADVPPHPNLPNEASGIHIGQRLQSYLQLPNPSSSQTTEDESAEQFARQTQLAVADDDDIMPEFVSARSLKRKRGQPSKAEIYSGRSSDGTPIKPFRVKEEPTSSPPRVHSLSRKETIDLDDPTLTMLRTPRHPKQNTPIYPTTSSTTRHQRSSSAPFSQTIKREEAHNTHTETVSARTRQLRNIEDIDTEPRAHSEPSDSTEGIPDVLRDLDPNSVAVPPEARSSKRTKHADTREDNAQHILSESGEEPPPLDENASRLTPLIARAKLNRRLHASVSPQYHAGSAHQTSTPVTTKIKLEPKSISAQSTSRKVHTPLPNTSARNPHPEAQYVAQAGPAIDKRPQWTMRPSESRSSIRKTRVSPARKQGPLRQKPVTELSAQDFKPNPAYNQGYTYAFSETVRKRGDRACLPGCTNPQCCGSTFRTFAEAQAPLSSSQEEALLEDYLGEAYDNMNLTQMSSEERQELVLQARTKKMAKEAGKHREAYERRKTPPGFWRVDFPTTQEQQEDRERSREEEKRNVQERWLEAQRKGGRWIFRDE
jgi:hypothetical protein